MTKIHAFTVSRANSPARAKALISTITEARHTAGHPFTWHLYCPSGSLAANFAESAQAVGLLDGVTVWPDNRGQHVAFNAAYAAAKEAGAEFLLRIDDDVEWLTKRWLLRLLEASKAFEHTAIVGPRVIGLKNPPPRSEEVEVSGIPVEFLEGAIGGVCRLHPMHLLERGKYVSDVRLPLGSGDAVGIGRWCVANQIPMVWAKTARIRHLTVKQDQDTEHKDLQSLFYLIPYIPAWRSQ